MKKKKYVYAISYFHLDGYGCVQIFRNKKINSYKDFDNVRKFISEENNLERVIIINIMLIGKTREWLNDKL